MLALPAFAADIQVYPIRLNLDPTAPTAVMTLVNRGDAETLLQLNVVAWSQDDKGDQLQPTRDILANPGVFLLKGGDQQVARFALRVPTDIKERSYRVVIQEVPRQRIENGLSTVLRMLVPVFVPPANPTMAIEWSVRQFPAGLEVTAHNNGNVHVQLKLVKLAGSGGVPLTKLANMYILPGSSGRLRIPTTRPVPAGTLQLTADSDQGGFSASVHVGAVEGVPAHP